MSNMTGTTSTSWNQVEYVTQEAHSYQLFPLLVKVVQKRKPCPVKFSLHEVEQGVVKASFVSILLSPVFRGFFYRRYTCAQKNIQYVSSHASRYKREYERHMTMPLINFGRLPR